MVSSFSPRLVLCVGEVDAQPEKMDTLAATPISSKTTRTVLNFGITWFSELLSSFQIFRFASAPFRGQYPSPAITTPTSASTATVVAESRRGSGRKPWWRLGDGRPIQVLRSLFSR